MGIRWVRCCVLGGRYLMPLVRMCRFAERLKLYGGFMVLAVGGMRLIRGFTVSP